MQKDSHGCSSLDEFHPHEENWPVLEPYFHVVFSQSQVTGKCQMMPPLKITRLLPQSVVPVLITYQNKDWDMTYNGEGNQKRFDGGWKKFVRDNNFKIGDGGIFELTEFNTECIKFRVQILSGEIPLELLDRISGNHVDNPISID